MTLQIMKKTILLALMLLITSSSYCQWTYGYLHDEFGDKTLKKFIVFTTQKAFFSKEGKVNVNRNPLKVNIKVQTNNVDDKYPYSVCFELFEANNNKAINSTSAFPGAVSLHVKLSDGRIMEYLMFPTSANLTTMLFPNDKELIDLMLNEIKPIRCLIKINSFHTIYQYNFSIDPTGFTAMFNRHIAMVMPQKSSQKVTESPELPCSAEFKLKDTTEGLVFDYYEITNKGTNEDKPVYGVEQMPQFPGGDKELMKFIHDNLEYPKVAAEVGIEGRVTIRFVIARDGNITDVTVIRGLDPSCDKEAVRIVKMMPRWIPGRQNGRNVPVYYTLPIVYKMKK